MLANLTLRGLVFSAEEPFDPRRDSYDNGAKCDFDSGTAQRLYPARNIAYLPAPAPLPELAGDAVDYGQRTAQEGSARTFQRDLYLYWSFVRARPVTLTAKGEVQKRTLVEINNALLIHDEIPKGVGRAATAAPALYARPAAIAEFADVSIPTTPNCSPPTTTEFFSLSPAERVQRVYAQWLDGDFSMNWCCCRVTDSPRRRRRCPPREQIGIARRS